MLCCSSKIAILTVVEPISIPKVYVMCIIPFLKLVTINKMGASGRQSAGCANKVNYTTRTDKLQRRNLLKTLLKIGKKKVSRFTLHAGNAKMKYLTADRSRKKGMDIL